MPQIQTAPLLEWAAGQVMAITVDCSGNIPAGRDLDDWATFTLTIREDPEFPRGLNDLRANLDPHGDGWEIAVQETGTGDAGEETIAFEITAPSDPGVRRYSLDVWGTGGTAGAVQLVRATWLTILPSVR